MPRKAIDRTREPDSPTDDTVGVSPLPQTPDPPEGDRSAGDLTILNAIAEALNSSPTVDLALARTLSLVASLLGLRTGWVWLRDPDTGRFYSAAAQNLPPYLREPVRMTGRSCWCIESFAEGELTPKNIDVLTCSRLLPAARLRATDRTEGLRYHASIPLSFQDKPLGIMNVTGPDWRELTPRELELLSTIAYQVGIAVERARLAEESTRLARAEERTRLAREIHDTLAQGLTGIALQIEGALRHLESNPARARERLERALATARESLAEARRSVLNLRAAPLAGRPLAEALAALGRSFATQTGIRVHVRATGDPALPLNVEAELFRIAQEALTNVRRHARASEVDIVLRADAARISLAIRDNGRGFAVDAGRRARAGSGHHGIVGMRERAKLLGGRLRIESRPGGGTTVRAVAPRRPEEAP
ncbi:MAG TPA: GAF domain-containing sensor histidine kinase [Dehalococcoidia bacterium]|nr:GAF domain-containing sensor histidine kinase [Dehalococcoidia bacterium]